MLIDQGEIKNKVPTIIFYNEEEGKLLFSRQPFAFHEYAFGNTKAVFEEEKKA